MTLRFHVLLPALLLLSACIFSACGEGTGDADAGSDTTGKTTAAADDEERNGEDENAPVKVESITLARDDNGDDGEVVEALKPDDNPFHAVIQFDRIGSSAAVKTELIAVDTEAGKNISVVSQESDLGLVNNYLDNTFSLPRPWPAGSYRIDVYVNGALAKSKEFTIAP